MSMFRGRAPVPEEDASVREAVEALSRQRNKAAIEAIDRAVYSWRQTRQLADPATLIDQLLDVRAILARPSKGGV